MTEEKPEFKAAVGLSREWDAYGAGVEVAQDTLQKLGCKPDFFLLFTTIHYEKHGGFKKFLEGVWDVLPEGTPLIGGTVAGFINPQGCYTRGATALAVKYPNMDVAIGIGHNTKRNPKKAAQECAKPINSMFNNSKFQNTFIFDLISGSIIPQIPGVGRKRILGGLLSTIAELSYNFSLYYLQKGSGREDEVIKEFIKETGGKTTLGGSSMDDNNAVVNYQFFNKNCTTNSIVALAIKTDITTTLTTDSGTKPTNKYFIVTKFSKDKRIIKEINNKPAVKGFLETLGWPSDFLNERLYRKTFHYPFTFRDKDGNVGQTEVGLILGSSVLFTYMSSDQKFQMSSATGKTILSGVVQSIQKQNNTSKLGLIVSCAARLEALGYKLYSVKNELDNYYRDSPYLDIYVMGESANIPAKGLFYGNLTFNMANFN